MSFTNEVAKFASIEPPQATATPPPASPPPPAQVPPAPAPTGKSGDPPPSAFDFNSGLPVGKNPVDPAATPPEPPPPAAPESKKAPIKIGAKEFQSMEEALQYAAEIDRAQAENKAYIEGVKDATKPPEVKPEEPKKAPLHERYAKKLFENPEEASKELIDEIKQEIREEYNTSVKQQTEAQQIAAQRNAAWEAFYQQNPDLSAPETRDIVQNHLLNKHMKEIGSLSPMEGLNKLAEISRAALRIAKEATLPKEELPAGPVTMAGVSGEATPRATQTKTEEIVDLVTAVRRLGKRRSS